MFLSTIALITIFSLQISISTSSPSKKSSESSADSSRRPVRKSKMATVVNPVIMYPFNLRVTTRGKTQIPLPQEEERPQRPAYNGQVEGIGEKGVEVPAAADRRGVPSHVVAMKKKQPQQQHFQNATHLSSVATHEKQINNSTGGSGEQNDNAIGVEHLPTIAVPFLDTLAHGIINEVHHHVQLIKPGTKWCGEGNKARYYEDVGVLHKTDKCCRSHDKCPYFILSHESKYGLHNDAHFTRSHCDCDAAFYDCLKKVNSPFSHGVGITYFNILKMKCFRLEYPVVMCGQSTGWFSKHCIEYIVNMGKRKQWQWFDNHEF